MAVWVLSADWHCCKPKLCDCGQTLWWSCHVLSLHCALAFALQMRKNHGETSVGVPERCLAKQLWTRFLPSTWSPFCVGLDWPVDPGRTKLALQATWVTPRLALNICWITELRHSPQQLTLSRDSWLGLWRGGEERNSQIGVQRQQGEETSTVTPVASWRGCGQRTTRWVTRSPSWDRWAYCMYNRTRSRCGDHFCLGKDPTLSASGKLSF